MWATRFNAAAYSCVGGRWKGVSSFSRAARIPKNISLSSCLNQQRIIIIYRSSSTSTSTSTSPPPPKQKEEQPATSSKPPNRRELEYALVDNIKYTKDPWYNLSQNILDKLPRQLHLQKDHPLSITRQIIESVFPPPTYRYHTPLNPVVSTGQNFDSLGFPADHPGRAKSDTYYLNSSTLLRTHTSAHQADTFRANLSPGYLISADVYRRDEVDRSHYPIFHQMEGARSWERQQKTTTATATATGDDVADQVWSDLEKLPKPLGLEVHDPNPPFHPDRNPLQSEYHTPAEVEAIGAHLKRSLELMVVEIFSHARAAARRSQDPAAAPTSASASASDAAQEPDDAEPLRVRWVEAYFPFTSPSWELEVFWEGSWLEVLGCGVVQQSLYVNAGWPQQRGWAFGVGLDRLAMLMFQIPDIRLFWSRDNRFSDQFRGVSDDLSRMRRFVPFSRHPPCYKDVSFWLPSPATEEEGAAAAGGKGGSDTGTDTAAAAAADAFHENDFMETVRAVAGDVVEDVRLVDAFTHPSTGRRSLCYRINYRSLERNLTNTETNVLHANVSDALVRKLAIEIR